MKKILFIYYDKEKDCVIIHDVKNNETIIKEKSILSYIKKLCFMYGSDYNGRKLFALKLLKIRKQVPILIDHSFLMFPLGNIKKNDCIWVRYDHIEKIFETSNNNTKIRFSNQYYLTVSISKRCVNTQLKRCKTIISFLD